MHGNENAKAFAIRNSCSPCVYDCGVASTKKSKQVSATRRRARVSARATSITSSITLFGKAKLKAPPITLADMANVGPATLGDLKLLGIQRVEQLAKLQPSDAFVLWRKLGRLTGGLHDPCVIDVFMSVISQAHGNTPCPWWHFTKQRKAMMAAHAKHQLTNTRSH
jgi:predicted flap endonuclease-1-like 5' DNA nuclease